MSSDPPIAGLRVFVVDDEPSVARSIARLLQAEGMHADVFEDPRRAIAQLERGQPDVLVVDYDMPGLTGAALVRQVRAAAGGPSTPAVLVTGNRRGVPVEDRAPFEAVLEKPYDPMHLVKLVEYCAYMRSDTSARSGTRRRASVALEPTGQARDATGEQSSE